MEKASKPEFLDQAILEKRREKLKASHVTLEGGIYIQGEVMTFKRKEILDSFSLMVPTSFGIMNEDFKSVKYTSKFAPAYLLTSEDLSVNLGFSMFIDHTPKESVVQIAQGIKDTLESNQSTFDFGEMASLEKVNGCYFQFFQTTLDTDMFHVMAFVRISDKIMKMSFNCMSDLDYMTWKNTVIQMLESIEKYEKEER